MNAEPEGISSGWGSTQSENVPSLSASIAPPAPANTCPRKVTFHMKGWRKISLYAILVFLMIIVFVNIGLTLWIIAVLKFSTDGIGTIRIVKGGLQLSGIAFVQDALIASSISSRPSQPLVFRAYRNFTIVVNDDDGFETLLIASKNRVSFASKQFKVTDRENQTLFAVNKDDVTIGSDSLTLSGEGGISFEESIQTPIVRADIGQNLSLESPTRSLELRAPESLVFESKAGEINATAFSDITLFSMTGAIQLDAANVYIKNMQIAKPATAQHKIKSRRDIYQLCACADGKLFLASPSGLCEAYDDKFCT